MYLNIIKNTINTRPYILDIASIANISIADVGGTLAYLNAVTETKTNTFTSSRNITTTLTETEWTSDSGKNYLPGDVIKKNPVMNNESDQPVYMAVKVDYLDDNGNLMSAEEFKKYASITDYDNDNWKMATVNSDGSEVSLNQGVQGSNPWRCICESLLI